MEILVFVALVAFGFLSGYFLATPALIVLTIVAIANGVYLNRTCKELAVLIAMAFNVCATIAILVMWITWYIVTNQHWLGDFGGEYIFR